MDGTRALRLLTLVLAALALAASAVPPVNADGVGGWTEAVVVTRDPSATARMLRAVGGWRVVGRGTVTRGELDYWKLPRAVRARYLRLCAPAAAAGCIRFVRIDGAVQRPIRLAMRPWDTGGIFSIMMRSTNVRATFDRALAAGWSAEAPPYGFAFGPSKLWNVVLTGPDGINLALYERESPPFTEYPLTPLSRGFNSMRMVRDQLASVAFYTRLGFTKAFDADYVDPRPQPNNMSIPVNLADRIARRAAAMHPVAGDTGRIEVMQFVGLTGRDVAVDAAPPNLGIVALRFPVRDAAAWRATLAGRGIAAVYAADGVQIGGLGVVDLFAVRDPDGALTEFYAPREAR